MVLIFEVEYCRPKHIYSDHIWYINFFTLLLFGLFLSNSLPRIPDGICTYVSTFSTIQPCPSFHEGEVPKFLFSFFFLRSVWKSENHSICGVPDRKDELASSQWKYIIEGEKQGVENTCKLAPLGVWTEIVDNFSRRLLEGEVAGIVGV